MSSGIIPNVEPRKTKWTMAIPPLSSQASAHLNTLRAVAAFVVLMGHWRNIFFVDWPQVQHRNMLLALLYGSTRFGHEAVVVFFVLSGYLIGRNVLRTVWAGTWSTGQYALHRLVRLEIVLLPALCLCWFWDTAGIRMFSPSPTYMGFSGSRALSSSVPPWINLKTFLGNLVFLQGISVHTFGSNGPLWSLANEFWYYALFPCLVLLCAAHSSWFRRIVAACVMIAIALFIGKWMLAGFFIWLIGVALIFLPGPSFRKGRYHALLFAAALLLVVVQLGLVAGPYKSESSMYADYLLAIVVAFLLYTLLHGSRPISRLYQSVSAHAAGFSYTLYLTHLPLLVFFSAWLNRRRQPTLGAFLIPIAILCVTVVYSYGIAMIFERNTNRVRKRLEATFGA
jgi:peptidoglycan/LPS O-acetylase OafA/YrhL